MTCRDSWRSSDGPGFPWSRSSAESGGEASVDPDFTWLSGAGEERNGQDTKSLRRRIRPTQRILEAWFKDWGINF